MFLIAFGRAAQLILAVLMMRVVSTLLPPSEMGRMSLFTSATAFFALFLVNPVGMFINRRLHAWDDRGLIRQYLGYYCGYLLVAGALGSVTLIALSSLNLVNLDASCAWIWVLVCGSLLFNTANQTVIPSLNLLGYRGWFVILTLATLGSGFAIAALLLHLFQPRAEYWLLGLLIGQILFAAAGSKVLSGRIRRSPESAASRLSRDQVLNLMRFAWPVAVAVGLNWIQAQSYRFLIGNTQGLTELGLFVAGYGLSAGLMAGFESVLTTYFQPQFYRKVSSENRDVQVQAWASYAGAIVPAIVLLVCFIMVMAPDLTRILLGPRYHTSGRFVGWGAMAEAFRVIAGVYTLAAHASMKTRLLLIPNLLGALVAVGMLLLLTPHFGIYGVGIALACAGLTVVMASHVLIRMAIPLKLPYARIGYGLAMGAAFSAAVVMAHRLIPAHANDLFLVIAFMGGFGTVFTLLQYCLLRNALLGKDSL